MAIEFKTCNAEEIKQIYDSFLKYDFPKDEVKPLQYIMDLYEVGGYTVIAAKDGDRIAAYACFIACEDPKLQLMDYFAVVRDLRGSGVGSYCMAHLWESMPQMEVMLWEVESPEAVEYEDEIAFRKRRIEFYEKNNGRLTNLFYNVINVEYQLMYLPKDGSSLTDEEICKAYETAYDAMLPQELKGGVIRIK